MDQLDLEVQAAIEAAALIVAPEQPLDQPPAPKKVRQRPKPDIYARLTALLKKVNQPYAVDPMSLGRHQWFVEATAEEFMARIVGLEQGLNYFDKGGASGGFGQALVDELFWLVNLRDGDLVDMVITRCAAERNVNLKKYLLSDHPGWWYRELKYDPSLPPTARMLAFEAMAILDKYNVVVDRWLVGHEPPEPPQRFGYSEPSPNVEISYGKDPVLLFQIGRTPGHLVEVHRWI